MKTIKLSYGQKVETFSGWSRTVETSDGRTFWISLRRGRPVTAAYGTRGNRWSAVVRERVVDRDRERWIDLYSGGNFSKGASVRSILRCAGYLPYDESTESWIRTCFEQLADDADRASSFSKGPSALSLGYLCRLDAVRFESDARYLKTVLALRNPSWDDLVELVKETNDGDV